MPPVFVGLCFLALICGALAIMAYVAWRGSQPSTFYSEAVRTTYDLELSDADIEAYFELKERLQRTHAPESVGAVAGPAGEVAVGEPWTRKVPPEERGLLHKALMKRLVSCIGKLDQVQRDKPGHWKLWQMKLVSERYWGSLLDAERMVSQEIDACVAEAEELEPGWRDHVFPQAVQVYRMQKQQEHQRKAQKKAVEHEKKAKEKEVKRKEVEKRQEVEDKVRQEKAAEKAMEKLLREEENEKARAKSKAKPKAKRK